MVAFRTCHIYGNLLKKRGQPKRDERDEESYPDDGGHFLCAVNPIIIGVPVLAISECSIHSAPFLFIFTCCTDSAENPGCFLSPKIFHLLPAPAPTFIFSSHLDVPHVLKIACVHWRF